jgi:hypothetical protein
MDRRPRRRFLGATLPHLALSLSLLLGVPDLFATDPPAGPLKGCVKNGTDTLQNQLASGLRATALTNDIPGSPDVTAAVPSFTAFVPVEEALTSPYIAHRYTNSLGVDLSPEEFVQNGSLDMLRRDAYGILESDIPPFVASPERDLLVNLLTSSGIEDLFRGGIAEDAMRFFERLTSNPRAFLPNLTTKEAEQVGKLAQELRTALNDKYLLRNTEYLDAVAKIAKERKAGRVSATRAPPKHSQAEVPGVFSSTPRERTFVDPKSGKKWAETVSTEGVTFYVGTLPGPPPTEITVLHDSQGNHLGQFTGVLDKNKNEFTFLFSKRLPHAPSFVHLPGVPDLVPGRGIPTALAASLLQLRRAGLQRGSLKKALGDRVVNGDTIFELLQAPEIRAWIRLHPRGTPPVPYHLLEKVFLNTQIGRYIQSTMLQTGHRITGVKLSGGYVGTVHDVISWSSRQGTPIDSAMIEAALFEGTGPNTSVLRPDVVFPFGFDVEFTLAPL